METTSSPIVNKYPTHHDLEKYREEYFINSMKFREENREKYLIRISKQNKNQNSEEIDYDKYFEKFKQEMREYNKKYREQNKEKLREQNRKYRERKRKEYEAIGLNYSNRHRLQNIENFREYTKKEVVAAEKYTVEINKDLLFNFEDISQKEESSSCFDGIFDF